MKDKQTIINCVANSFCMTKLIILKTISIELRDTTLLCITRFFMFWSCLSHIKSLGPQFHKWENSVKSIHTCFPPNHSYTKTYVDLNLDISSCKSVKKFKDFSLFIDALTCICVGPIDIWDAYLRPLSSLSTQIFSLTMVVPNKYKVLSCKTLSLWMVSHWQQKLNNDLKCEPIPYQPSQPSLTNSYRSN